MTRLPEAARGDARSVDSVAKEALGCLEFEGLTPNMSRNFTEEHVLHVRDSVLPSAVEDRDVEVVRACEAVLTAHGYAMPNVVSGKWEPIDVPRSELQLREMFAHKMPEYGYGIVRSGDEFPDWLLRDSAGRFLYTEVEHRSSSFQLHGHDPALCDLVVCWEHDDPELQVPVFECLSERLYEAEHVVEQGDKSTLAVNWVGLRASESRPVRASTRTRASKLAKASRIREVYQRHRQMTLSGMSRREATKRAAAEHGISESTVNRYLSEHRAYL